MRTYMPITNYAKRVSINCKISNFCWKQIYIWKENWEGVGWGGGEGVGAIGKAEPVFVNLLKNSGIEGGYDNPVWRGIDPPSYT